MWPDQRMKEWCNYNSSSESSRPRRVRSSTSRRPPSRKSSDFDTRFVFFPLARAPAASDTAHLATLARLIVRGSVWRTSLFIWSTFSLGRRQLCVVATPAFAGRLLETRPEDEAYRGPSPSQRFPTPRRFAPAWVSPHPSTTKLAIFQAAVAPAAALSPNTPSAESFAVTCAWPMWKCITYFGD